MNTATLLHGLKFFLKWLLIPSLLLVNVLLALLSILTAIAPPYPGTACGTPTGVSVAVQFMWMLLIVPLLGLIFLFAGAWFSGKAKWLIWLLAIVPPFLTIGLIMLIW